MNYFKEELKPIPNTQNSFYKKAYTVTDGVVTVLFSYNTPICVRINPNGGVYRIYNGGYSVNRRMYGFTFPDYVDDISPTTLRHIKAFCGKNKRQYLDSCYYLFLPNHLKAKINGCINYYRGV